MKKQNPIFKPKFLDCRQVVDITGLSKSTIYRMEGNNLFPKRLKISPKRVGWPTHLIEKWCASRQRANE